MQAHSIPGRAQRTGVRHDETQENLVSPGAVGVWIQARGVELIGIAEGILIPVQPQLRDGGILPATEESQ